MGKRLWCKRRAVDETFESLTEMLYNPAWEWSCTDADEGLRRV